ncbi:MAG: flagella accessory protein C [Candidatus Thermoplasmatota archaeon]|jgi:flagellar protein FlaC|nr:flagella accessory protein C [Candidatus Thermoplasmatota archaeon]
MGKGEDSKPTDETITMKTSETTTPPTDTKKDVESLRKIIKFGSAPEDEDKKPAISNDKIVVDQKTENTEEQKMSREALEQKRAILQSIKDFDFQIKKNQEDINNLNQKLDAMSKDLDDLVSLYEIVSEQMNPFVGLSKVTKKRLDSLENFTKEIETVKTRLGDLESFAERMGMKIENPEIRMEEKANPSVENLSDMDLDRIIELSLREIASENAIDKAIDEFIENLRLNLNG